MIISWRAKFKGMTYERFKNSKVPVIDTISTEFLRYHGVYSNQSLLISGVDSESPYFMLLCRVDVLALELKCFVLGLPSVRT